MADREQAADIDDAAVDWAAKAERGLTEAERVALDQWLAGDPRRLGAFVRAQAAWMHAERAGALGSMPEGNALELAPDASGDQPTTKHLTRRMLLGGGAAVAASITAVVLVGRERFRTLGSGLGEVRKLALADGTTLMLDTSTTVEVAENSRDRKLSLTSGRLFLDVRRSEVRPFVLEAAGLVMKMAEGAFSVQSISDLPLVALVTRGKLAVSVGESFFGTTHRLELSDNQKLSLSPGATLPRAAVRPIAADERDQLLAWRDGMLSFGGEALATAVRAFDRYSPTRIVIADPELGRQRITGLFKADDPRGFATAVAASFGGIVSGEGDVIRISSEKVSSG